MQKILIEYQLPGFENQQEVIPTKEQWELLDKQTVNKYWTDKLKAGASEKSTLCYLNTELLKIVQPIHCGLPWIQPCQMLEKV